MRFTTLLCLLALPLVARTQIEIPLERFEWSQSVSERPDISVIPIWVLNREALNEIYESEGLDAFNAEVKSIYTRLWPEVATVFSSIRDAMWTLGVYPYQYNLHLAGHYRVLRCSEATVSWEQNCYDPDLEGDITDLPNFIYDLYDQESPPKGTIQLHVLILQDGVAWKGILGKAWHWWWVRDRTQWHWTNRACRAWALHSTSVIAHELGHCFGLQHNEEDIDSGLDLMLSYYTHFDWVKGSNKKIVQQHFQYPTPNNANSMLMDRPMMELIY